MIIVKLEYHGFRQAQKVVCNKKKLVKQHRIDLLFIQETKVHKEMANGGGLEAMDGIGILRKEHLGGFFLFGMRRC